MILCKECRHQRGKKSNFIKDSNLSKSFQFSLNLDLENVMLQLAAWCIFFCNIFHAFKVYEIDVICDNAFKVHFMDGVLF